MALQYLKGAYKQKGNQLSTWSDSDSKRENGFKPKISEIYVRWKFFVQRVVRHWLPREVADALFLEVYKARLNGDLGNLM